MRDSQIARLDGRDMEGGMGKPEACPCRRLSQPEKFRNPTHGVIICLGRVLYSGDPAATCNAGPSISQVFPFYRSWTGKPVSYTKTEAGMDEVPDGTQNSPKEQLVWGPQKIPGS